MYLVCKAADIGYSIGDKVSISSASCEAPDTGVSIMFDNTDISIIFGNSTRTFTLINLTAYTLDSIDNSKWKLVVSALG